MSEFNSGKPKPWNIYGSSYPSPSQTEVGREGPWNSFGTSSMNAISFGFVATAILISMFLIMAIFEHLFRANAPFSSSPDDSTAHLESLQIQKLGDSQTHIFVAGTSIICIRFLSSNARTAISYLHCTTCSSTLSKRRSCLLAFPSTSIVSTSQYMSLYLNFIRSLHLEKK